MSTITRDSLLTLEDYAKVRKQKRDEVMTHKKARKIPLGDHVILLFEDDLTIRYQIQEMLHIERIFQEDEITHELETYLPLVPDGTNWKATMMIEYPDPSVRADRLAKMVGIEDSVWVKIDDLPPVYAIADEDLDRENTEKTSAVHFLRFELSKDMIRALRQHGNLSMGVDHPAYRVVIESIDEQSRASLINDLIDIQ
ncbi:Protein of unknown function [Nitrosomonas sp. Nm51]|uniref:DUF3501 family protein n=1 Tax=Nitrosomonas sp. Nm51 TaxID=133720 RepID=UPI0008C0FA22|nr:DUF3501 family protein [Nitrosomonas sp. Nm51]SER22029.1 Protein of unknown function [Nitrosomonas sp. Nm51]